MTLDNFASHIPPAILARATFFAKKHAVSHIKERSIHHDSISYSATVKGTSDTYYVQLDVTIESREIERHSCTCPFDGEICKHVAAVIIALSKSGDQSDDDDDNEEPESNDSKGNPVKPRLSDRILKDLPEAEVRNYLRELLREQPSVEKHFVATFASRSAAGKSDYKDLITTSIQGLRGARSFTDRSAVHRAMVPVHKLLEQAGQALIIKQYQTVADITEAVMEKLVPSLRYIDDSGGSLGDCISEATELMYELAIMIKDTPLCEAFFMWCLKSSTHKKYQGWDCAWDFARMAVLTATADDERKIVAMTTALKREGNDDSDSWIRRYQAERASELLLKFHELHKTKQETDAFIDQHIQLLPIRKVAVERAVKKRHVQEAIALCREGVRIAVQQKLPGVVSDWYQIMMDINIQIEDRQGILECATQLFYSEPTIKLYDQFKSLLKKNEWPQKRMELIERFLRYSKFHNLATIYSREGEQDDLLNVLRLSRHVALLDEFRDAVDDAHRSALQQLYFDITYTLLEQYSDRRHYSQVATILRNMMPHFDHRAVTLFAQEMRKNYAHRPALLKELAAI